MKRRRTYSDQLSMLTLMQQPEQPFHGFRILKQVDDAEGRVLSVTILGPDYPVLEDEHENA